MEDSIIIGTKVSLSRNINNYPFPHKLSQSESQVIANNIRIGGFISRRFYCIQYKRH